MTTYRWTGAAGDHNFQNPKNWNPEGVPTYPPEIDAPRTTGYFDDMMEVANRNWAIRILDGHRRYELAHRPPVNLVIDALVVLQLQQLDMPTVGVGIKETV